MTLEELVRKHGIADAPIAAVDLEPGMVLRAAGTLRIVISVLFENTESGPVAIVESAKGLERFAGDSALDVWHIDGEPFLVELPPEDMGAFKPPQQGGGSPSPAHDAAGIVPVWQGPKRIE